MNSAMQTFYSRLTSGCEENPLFLALRNLTRLDVRSLTGGDGDDSLAWSPWDPTGNPPDATMAPAL